MYNETGNIDWRKRVNKEKCRQGMKGYQRMERASNCRSNKKVNEKAQFNRECQIKLKEKIKPRLKWHGSK